MLGLKGALGVFVVIKFGEGVGRFLVVWDELAYWLEGSML